MLFEGRSKGARRKRMKPRQPPEAAHATDLLNDTLGIAVLLSDKDYAQDRNEPVPQCLK